MSPLPPPPPQGSHTPPSFPAYHYHPSPSPDHQAYLLDTLPTLESPTSETSTSSVSSVRNSLPGSSGHERRMPDGNVPTRFSSARLSNSSHLPLPYPSNPYEAPLRQPIHQLYPLAPPIVPSLSLLQYSRPASYSPPGRPIGPSPGVTPTASAFASSDRITTFETTIGAGSEFENRSEKVSKGVVGPRGQSVTKAPHGSAAKGALPDKPFKCDQCMQSFNRNHDLKRHKQIHLAVKPYPCDKCDKAFSRKDALRRHWLVKGCRPDLSKEGAEEPSVPGSSVTRSTSAPSIDSLPSRRVSKGKEKKKESRSSFPPASKFKHSIKTSKQEKISVSSASSNDRSDVAEEDEFKDEDFTEGRSESTQVDRYPIQGHQPSSSHESEPAHFHKPLSFSYPSASYLSSAHTAPDNFPGHRTASFSGLTPRAYEDSSKQPQRTFAQLPPSYPVLDPSPTHPHPHPQYHQLPPPSVHYYPRRPEFRPESLDQDPYHSSIMNEPYKRYEGSSNQGERDEGRESLTFPSRQASEGLSVWHRSTPLPDQSLHRIYQSLPSSSSSLLPSYRTAQSRAEAGVSNYPHSYPSQPPPQIHPHAPPPFMFQPRPLPQQFLPRLDERSLLNPTASFLAHRSRSSSRSTPQDEPMGQEEPLVGNVERPSGESGWIDDTQRASFQSYYGAGEDS